MTHIPLYPPQALTAGPLSLFDIDLLPRIDGAAARQAIDP